MGTIIAIGAGIAVLGALGAGIVSVLQPVRQQRQSQDSRRQKVRSTRH